MADEEWTGSNLPYHNAETEKIAREREEALKVVEILELVVEPIVQGSGSERGWDSGFAQEGDPYGILKEYISESANPDAVVDPSLAD